MIRKLLLACILCVIVSSCRKSSSGGSDETYDVSFLPNITTRATELYFEVGDNINVTSFDSGVVHSADVSYTYTSSSLFTSSSPIEKLSDQSLTYIATYPAQSGVDSSFSFMANTDQSSSDSFVESDLMLAIDSSSSITPELTFTHVMAKLSVTLNITNNSGGSIEVSDMLFYLKRGSVVTCDIDTESVSVTQNSASAIEIIPYQESSTVYSAIISPQIITNGDLMATMLLDGSGYQWNIDKSMEFKSGQHYNYTWDITISSSGGVESTVDLNSDITPWDYVDISSDSSVDSALVDSDSDININNSNLDSSSAALLDKSGFSGLTLLGDATASQVTGGNILSAFDGVNTLLDYDSSIDTNGTYMLSATGKTASFDLGGDYILTEYKFWQRRWSLIYDNYNVKSFRLWGATTEASDDNGVTLKSDYQLVTDTGLPDFTTMGDKWVELVYESGLVKPYSTEEQQAAALAGHSYSISEQTAVRYLRIEFLEQWDTSSSLDSYHFSELDITGIKR